MTPDKIRYFLNRNNNYTMDELYEAFQDATACYLEEFINTLSFEEYFLENYEPEQAETIIEEIATQVPDEDFPPYKDNEDNSDYIEALVSYIESTFGINDEE